MSVIRYSGQVDPTIPHSAPLSYRLDQEVYALDGLGADYIVSPGARLEVGPGGELFETLGSFPGGKKGMYVAGAVGAAAIWWFFLRKKGRR